MTKILRVRMASVQALPSDLRPPNHTSDAQRFESVTPRKRVNVSLFSKA